MRTDSQDSIKEVGHIPTAPQEEPSLSNRYVRGTLNMLPHVQWIPRFPDLKECRISLQWLECRLVFLLTIQRDVWIFCAVPREIPMSNLIWTEGLTSLDTSRGPRSLVFRKEPRPDPSWKLIGIPISLWKLESGKWSPTSPTKRLFYLAKPSLASWGVRPN